MDIIKELTHYKHKTSMWFSKVIFSLGNNLLQNGLDK
jgi:hypothetical protein